jgi:lipocalin
MTDYTSYALISSCQQIIPYILKSQSAWIFSRTRTLSDSVVKDIKQFAADNGIDTSKFEITDQFCPELP